jgi:hypothetical protein
LQPITPRKPLTVYNLNAQDVPSLKGRIDSSLNNEIVQRGVIYEFTLPVGVITIQLDGNRAVVPRPADPGSIPAECYQLSDIRAFADLIQPCLNATA